MTSMEGSERRRVEEFPPEVTAQEKAVWYNYLLNQETPALISKSTDDNRRLWQALEVERMLDSHPPHEKHPNDLPDYHFWPPIQNDLEWKPKVITTGSEERVQDATDVPRFFKNGVPKTPRQYQDFYVPARPDGRFDWRRNIRENGAKGGSMFSRAGFDQRYLLAQNRPYIMLIHTAFFRQFAMFPLYFRNAEMPLWKRFMRHYIGSTFMPQTILTLSYVGVLMIGVNFDTTYKRLQWDNEPWNSDMAFQQKYRGQGGFHGIV
jgi:hypothetical protein